MWKNKSCLVLLVGLLFSNGCCRSSEKYPLPPSESISSYSVLQDACNVRSLAKPVNPSEKSLMWSSSLVSNKVVLTHLAPEITGDMDHGCFERVEYKPDCVEATLAEMSGSGMVTWIWSANPVGEICLYVDDKDQPVLRTSFKGFLAGRLLPPMVLDYLLFASGVSKDTW